MYHIVVKTVTKDRTISHHPDQHLSLLTCAIHGGRSPDGRTAIDRTFVHCTEVGRASLLSLLSLHCRALYWGWSRGGPGRGGLVRKVLVM